MEQLMQTFIDYYNKVWSFFYNHEIELNVALAILLIINIIV